VRKEVALEVPRLFVQEDEKLPKLSEFSGIKGRLHVRQSKSY